MDLEETERRSRNSLSCLFLLGKRNKDEIPHPVSSELLGGGCSLDDYVPGPRSSRRPWAAGREGTLLPVQEAGLLEEAPASSKEE